MLQPGDQGDVLEVRSGADRIQQVAHHFPVDAAVLGFRRLARPGRDEDMADVQALQGRRGLLRLGQVGRDRPDLGPAERRTARQAVDGPAPVEQPFGKVSADDAARADDERRFRHGIHSDRLSFGRRPPSADAPPMDNDREAPVGTGSYSMNCGKS